MPLAPIPGHFTNDIHGNTQCAYSEDQTAQRDEKLFWSTRSIPVVDEESEAEACAAFDEDDHAYCICCL